MRFEWDDAKAAANRRKHGVTFEDAITAFDDPWALLAPDPKHSGSEPRSWLIGEADVGVLVVVSPSVSPAHGFASSVLGGPAAGSVSDMPKARQFPFETARRITAREVESARKAIEQRLGKPRPRRGRPPKGREKFLAVSIRLHPRVVAWARKEARRRGLGYQTVINEALLKASA